MKPIKTFLISTIMTLGLCGNATAQTYANFQGIALDGNVFTAADFGLDPASNPKSAVITKQYEDFMGRGYDKDVQTVEFDNQGRLTSFSFDRASYSPLRVEYTYNPEGKVATAKVMEQLVTMVSKPTPLVTKEYTYTWNGDKVSSISETIYVDNGLNYKGNSTQLNLTYGAGGKLASAVCKETPRVKFNFDTNGKKTDGRSFQCDGYNNGYPYDSDFDKLDEVFRMVNLSKKLPLHWSNMDDDPTLVYGAPFEVDLSGAEVEKDSNGNWISAKFSGGEFPDIYTREIVYF